MSELTFKQQLLLTAMANPEFIILARSDSSRYTVKSTFAKDANKIISDLDNLINKGE